MTDAVARVPHRTRLGSTVAALAVLAAAAVLASTLWTVATHRSPLPFLDLWAIVADAEALDRGTLTAEQLLRLHNEHWIVIPRLLLLLDMIATRGAGWLAIALTSVFQALHVLLLVVLARKPQPDRTSMQAIVAATVVTLLFAAVQLENFVEPFQLQFVLVYLAATASLAALARAATANRPGRWLTTAITAGLVATLSMGNGILVWPFLVVLGWWLRLRRRAMTAIVATGLCAAALLVALYRAPPWHPNPTVSLQQPLVLLEYWLLTVGGAFVAPGAAARHPLAIAVAVTSLLALAVLLPPFHRRRPVGVSPSRAVLAAAALFVLASFAMIAVGRLPFGLASALAGRYGTPALLFTAMLLLLGRTDARPRVRVLTTGLAFVLAVAVALQQSTRIDATIQFEQRRGPATLACLCSIRDAATITEALGNVESLPLDEMVPFLRARRWSVFADGRHLVLGRSLADVVAGAPVTACTGSIEAIEPIADTGWGVRLRGNAQLPPGVRLPRHGIVVDGTDRVVGLCDVAPTAAGTTTVVFAGNAAVRGNGDELRAILGDDGARWSVSGVGRVTGVAVAAAAGPPLAAMPIASDGPFAPPATDPDAPAVASSFARVRVSTERGRGIATLGPFSAVREFALPVATGSSTFGLGALLLDESNGQVVSALRPAPTYGEWRLWKVEIPTELVGRPLTLKIGDLGDRDGQWLAFAEPAVSPP